MIGLSCHSRNYGPGTQDETFSFIKKLGFEYIDVDGVETIKQADVLENPDKQAQIAKELSQKYNIKLAEYFMGNMQLNGQSYSPSELEVHQRDSLYGNFDKICRFASQSGFSSIVGSAGLLRKDMGYERSFEYAAEVLRKMVSIAADHGVQFHVEPSMHSLLKLPAKALEMAQQVQGLKFTLDFLHFQAKGIDQEESMQLLEYMGHMHARQSAVGWAKCPYEFGEIDYDRIMKRLRGLKWKGIIAMEFSNGPAEEAAGMSPVEQTILMRYELKRLIKKYF
ncbi:sugar phosphate isomerase/epimerase family protein [Paenibacillus radicis (ex Xue et al. 2023)]|uniref:Sugar phosphate isomerase/epimerase n=1 Tax=Paenibacillus radicis (ex Xue et al. 2023) TaxID=2972489 RepID=A0ABT1YQ69_9BACL|nr:sugar phosphate isomerase/epimerase [Paenibacillus radicis (ex Xue et al. 2023)]MCR8635326.1 sugar phosphate isomerase/epimerase [Paenibacillus radicis (ex Xue et al. 2023)]